MKKLIIMSLFFAAMAFNFTSCELDDEEDGSINQQIVNETITTNVTWEAGTYVIDGSLYIQEGGHLTIEPGTIVKMTDGSKLIVTGTNSQLTAVGTVDSPIKFTTNSNTPSAGNWDYISFEQNASSASELSHCILEYGGGYASSYGGMLWLDDSHITVSNCTFSNSGYHGVESANGSYFLNFTNNIFTDNTAYDVSIEGNYAHTIGTGNIMNGNGILVDGDYFEQTTETWVLQTAPYTIDGTLYIGKDGGAELIIAAGNTIQFTDGGKLEVGYGSYGTLIANGTEELPILFTSSAVQKQPGQWDYIAFSSEATNTSILNYCIIEAAGGYASYTGSVDLNDCNVNITNTEIKLSESYGITLNSSAWFTTFTGNNIHDCGTYEIEINGNYVHTIGTDNTWDEDGLGIKVDADYFTQSDETWLAQSAPYVIEGTMNIGSASGSILRIEAGAILKFTESSIMEVGSGDFGSLIAEGTASNPIIFTTAAPTGAEQPGQWDGIYFGNNTGNGSILNYCEISYGGGYATSYNNGNINLYNVPDALPTISNCTISYSAGWGIYSDESNPTLSNNIFIGNTNGDIGSK